MRIVVHDFAGHPFPITLSRSLANRGHKVAHLYSKSVQFTPQGSLVKREDDPNGLMIQGIALSKPISKHSYLQRRKQEIEYGKRVAEEIHKLSPDVVISGNTPLETQKYIQRICEKRNIKFVFWVQDIYGVAVHRLLRKKLPVVGSFVGHYYLHLEKSLLQKSDEVILISEDFKSQMRNWNIDENSMHVIENWAPIDDVPLFPKDNDWAEKHNLGDKKCIIYSGTLGMKHNPEMLLALAKQVKEDSDVTVVVVSEGAGADWLKEKKRELKLNNLLILDFQPFEDVPKVLATADLLVAILEADAGLFSVPSKVLTYHCAGKPLLLAVPPENLAARIVEINGSGYVVKPNDMDRFVYEATRLINNNEETIQLGKNARKYAEKTFDIDSITDKFESLIG